MFTIHRTANGMKSDLGGHNYSYHCKCHLKLIFPLKRTINNILHQYLQLGKLLECQMNISSTQREFNRPLFFNNWNSYLHKYHYKWKVPFSNVRVFIYYYYYYRTRHKNMFFKSLIVMRIKLWNIIRKNISLYQL